MDEIQALNRRPYAATANVVAVLTRARKRNLPPKIDTDFYRLDNIPDVVFGRVREALTFLGLIDAEDRPTELLRALASASEDEYHELMADAIRSAYADDFARIDPAEDTQAQIMAAFHRYEPRSQTQRQVMLFLGLCRHAGILVKDQPRERKMQPRPKAQSGASSAPERGERYLLAQTAADRVFGYPRPGLLFGVTEEDIAALDEADFKEVWTALGKVALARARSRRGSSAPSQAKEAEEVSE